MGRARKVAVIGAGIAGLGAAWRLARRGFDVVLLERERHPGGRASSESCEGFTLEPRSAVLSTADRNLLEWIGEVGRRDELLPLRPVLSAQTCRARVSEIDPRGLGGVARIPGVKLLQAVRLVRLPRLLSRFGDRLDPEAPERAADLDDRSLSDFGRLYFGQSVLDRWMAPLVTGVSLDDERETSRVLFLQRYRTHGRARMGLPRSAFAELPEAAAAKLQTRYRAVVARIEARKGRGLRVLLGDGGDLQVDAVIVATAAPDAARLADSLLSPAERDGFARIRYLPALALAAGLRRPFSSHPQEIRHPHSEGSPLETTLLEPGVPGGRVPGGQGLATLHATGSWSEANFDAPDEAVAKELMTAFDRTHPGAPHAVLFQRLFRVPRALPRFGVGRYREIARFERVQADLRRAGRRLYFAGDYLMEPSWNGALSSGYRAARAVEADLVGD
jgi:protoporphyrinogen oxidase